MLISAAKQQLQSLRKSGLARDFALLAGGTAIAQAIAIAFAPLLTRIYGPDAFGTHGVFVSILAIAGTVSAAGYPLAIMLPRSDRDALAIVRVAVAISMVVATISATALHIGGVRLAEALGVAKIPFINVLLPAGILFTGFTQVASNWIFRKRAFRAYSAINIGNAFANGAARALIGVPLPIASTLIWITVVVSAAHAAALTCLAGRFPNAVPGDVDRKPPLVAVARQYSDFPLYRAPQDFINAAARGAPTIVLATTAGATPAGLYVLATMALGAPATLIGKSVGDALYPRLTQARNSGIPLLPILKRATLALALAGVVPFVAIAVTAPWLFEVAFGKEWRAAGAYAQLLSAFYFMNLVNRPAVASVPVIKRQGGLLIYEIASTFVKICGVVVGTRVLASDTAGVALFAIAGTLSYILLIGWIFRCAKLDDDIHAGQHSTSVS